MIAFFSVGYIFLSGVSYPLELMPWYWQAAHYVVPAAPAVLAFVKLNSMGGTLADIRPEMITLWIQVIVYFLLSLWVFKRRYSILGIKAVFSFSYKQTLAIVPRPILVAASPCVP